MFAAKPIPRGTWIIEYVGEPISEEETARRLEHDKAAGVTYLFDLDDTHCIDARFVGNDAKYINHGCDPNCILGTRDGRAWVVAARDIAEGEELSYDYDMDDDLGPLNCPCRCGSPGCRGVLVGKGSRRA